MQCKAGLNLYIPTLRMAALFLYVYVFLIYRFVDIYLNVYYASAVTMY